MKKYILNILAISTAVLLLMACKKDESSRVILPEGSVTFDLPAATDVVERELNIKDLAVVSVEMKAALEGATSSDVHYVTFAPDTTKIVEYRKKYGNNALLLPTPSYLYYKPTVAIPAGASVSEPAILNLGFQTTLKAHSTYVLPLVITSVDGQSKDPGTRRVVYYVFNTGDPLYVDHTGFTLTATSSSAAGSNTASRVVDANMGTTYWASATTVALPQFVSIDFARPVTFSGLDIFYPTNSNINYATTGGDPNSVKIETSSDNVNWVDKGTYTVDIRNTARKHTINLTSPTTARYVRVTVLGAAPYVAGTATYSIVLVSGIMLRS